MSVSLKEIAVRYRKSKLGMFGLGLLMFFLALALLAPIIAPNDPDPLNIVGPPYAAPGWMSFFDPGSFPTLQLVPNPGFEEKASGWNFYSDTGRALGRVAGEAFSGQSSFMFEIVAGGGATTAYIETPIEWPYDKTPADAWISYRIKVEMEGDVKEGDFDVFVAFVPQGYDRATWLAKSVNLLLDPRNIKDVGIEISASYSKIPEWRLIRERLNVAEIRAFFFNKTQALLRAVVDMKPTFGKSGKVKVWIDELEFTAFSKYFGVLGTSDSGADAWSQLVWGTQWTLFVALLATTVAVSVGVTMGLISGYFGSIVDEVIQRVVDFLIIIPLLPMLIVLAAILGQSVWNIILILILFGWLGTAKLIRAQTLSEKAKPYVEAAKASGASDIYIIFRHILPNVLPLVFVQLALFVSVAIQLEAALSFLGLGPAEVITWGKMLQFAFESAAASAGAWWYIIPPGLFIALLAMAFIFIGTTIDRIINPRLRGR